MEMAVERSSINDVLNESDLVIDFRSTCTSEPDSLFLLDDNDFLRDFKRRLRSEFLLPTLLVAVVVARTELCVFLLQFFESDSEVVLYLGNWFNADSLIEKLASVAVVSIIFASLKLCREFRVSCERHETDHGLSEFRRLFIFLRIWTFWCAGEDDDTLLLSNRPSVDVCKGSMPCRQVATESVISSDESDNNSEPDVYSPDASPSLYGNCWTFWALLPSFVFWFLFSHSYVEKELFNNIILKTFNNKLTAYVYANNLCGVFLTLLHQFLLLLLSIKLLMFCMNDFIEKVLLLCCLIINFLKNVWFSSEHQLTQRLFCDQLNEKKMYTLLQYLFFQGTFSALSRK